MRDGEIYSFTSWQRQYRSVVCACIRAASGYSVMIPARCIYLSDLFLSLRGIERLQSYMYLACSYNIFYYDLVYYFDHFFSNTENSLLYYV